VHSIVTKSKRPSKSDWHAGIVRRANLRREAEALDLCTIVTEHDRGNPRATMLALAATIDELRSNLRQLKSAIDGVLNGGGRIMSMPYGPHREEHAEKTLRLAHKQLMRSS
jgi:hypothetical protein